MLQNTSAAPSSPCTAPVDSAPSSAVTPLVGALHVVHVAVAVPVPVSTPPLPLPDAGGDAGPAPLSLVPCCCASAASRFVSSVASSPPPTFAPYPSSSPTGLGVCEPLLASPGIPTSISTLPGLPGGPASALPPFEASSAVHVDGGTRSDWLPLLLLPGRDWKRTGEPCGDSEFLLLLLKHSWMRLRSRRVSGRFLCSFRALLIE